MEDLLEKTYLPFALNTARSAGSQLLDFFQRKIEIRWKGSINLVTEADVAAEELIVEAIRSTFPEHQYLCEEGHQRSSQSVYRWIVDPLDGTTNFAHGYPCFCVSIALEMENEVILGVVYDPILNEMFHAVKGQGAFLNNRKIRVSSISDIGNSLLVTGFPYDIHTNRDNNLEHFRRFALSAQAIRRDGAAALDFCYLASGRFDGFWEIRLAPWDAAAGALIVKEAGGMVSNYLGGSFDPFVGQVVASNGFIHQTMIDILNL